MKLSQYQRGSTHLVAFVALAVVLAVGAVGYRVVQRDDTKNSASTASLRSVSVPPEIKSTSDVQKAINALDNTSIESTVNPSELDSDLQAL